MQGSHENKFSLDQDLQSEATVIGDFEKGLKSSNESNDYCEEEQKENMDQDNDDGEEEEEFSFLCGEACVSPIAAEDLFIDGQIKPVFPWFNGNLYLSGERPESLLESLQLKPPVNKIFVETSEVPPSPAADAEVVGPWCEWSNRKAVEVSPEACKKSNSTGFSKIWRFKELMGRSNSDGRDAFVFLNNSHAPPQPAVESERKILKVQLKKGGRTKTASLSAHEVYLRSKAKDEEKRRSYLPYRPELVGFFTNVNGGLSKNVHPF